MLEFLTAVLVNSYIVIKKLYICYIMKIYKSTAGCGYNEYAYVTPINNKKDYLCLFTNEKSSIPVHEVGEIIEDLDSIYLEESNVNIEDLEISKTFLFRYFMENNKLSEK